MSDEDGVQPDEEQALSGLPSEPLDRRALVRRSATIVAGAVAILAAPGLSGAASAAPGDSLRLGNRNRAGDAQTRLQSRTTVAPLSVLNQRVRTGTQYGDVDLVAPQLRLESPVPGKSRPQVPDVASLSAGDLAAGGGLLYFGAESVDFDVLPSQVFTSSFANFLQPIDAERATIFDSRSLPAAVRARYLADDFDALGRLGANRRISVDVRSLINTTSVPPTGAAALSITVQDGDESGVLTVFSGAQAAAGIDVVSYSVLPAAVTANGKPFALPTTSAAVVGLDAADQLWFAVSHAAHVVLRVTGIFVADPVAVVEADEGLPPGAPPTAARSAAQRQALRRLTAGIMPPK